jgi:hypothetical protein
VWAAEGAAAIQTASELLDELNRKTNQDT